MSEPIQTTLELYHEGNPVQLRGKDADEYLRLKTQPEIDAFMRRQFTDERPFNFPGLGQAKPPLGIEPRSVWEYLSRRERINSILDAVQRYKDAKKQWPREWTAELDYHVGALTSPPAE